MTRAFPDEAVRDAALLRWLRREVSRDLRYWRSQPGILPLARYKDMTDDCKAKLAMIAWAEHWQDVRTPEYARDHNFAERPDVQQAMVSSLNMVNAGIKRMAAGYRRRAGWRAEWNLQ